MLCGLRPRSYLTRSQLSWGVIWHQAVDGKARDDRRPLWSRRRLPPPSRSGTVGAGVTPLPVLKPREVVARLGRLGFVEVGQGGSQKQFRILRMRNGSSS